MVLMFLRISLIRKIAMKTIEWFYLRLKNKYKEGDVVLKSLESILNNSRMISKEISKEYIDNVCRKHFQDYDLDKCEEFTFGFTDQDRENYRKFAIDLIEGLSS